MTEQMSDIDRALRELPLCRPQRSAWGEIAARLEGDESKAEQRSRWMWAGVATVLIALNGVLFWPGDDDGKGDLLLSGIMGYSGNVYSSERELQADVLRRRISQLDQLIPYGTLEEQYEMYQYRNELTERLERVSFQPSETGIRL